MVEQTTVSRRFDVDTAFMSYWHVTEGSFLISCYDFIHLKPSDGTFGDVVCVAFSVPHT